MATALQTEIQVRRIIRGLIDEGLGNEDIRDDVCQQFRIGKNIVTKWIILGRRERTEEITSAVQRLLEARYHSGEIKRLVAIQYDLAPRTVQHYLCVARARLREITGVSKQEHRENAYGFYLSMIRDSSLPARDRIHAAERIDKLFSLEQAEPQTAIGLNLTREELDEMSLEQLEAMADKLQRKQQPGMA